MADLNQFLSGGGKYPVIDLNDYVFVNGGVSYTVPAGTHLLATYISSNTSDSNVKLVINGVVNPGNSRPFVSSDDSTELASQVLFPAGTTFTMSTGTANLTVRGFLITNFEDL